MPDWEERITLGSHPSLRLEHAVRYRAAAPIIEASDVWCDLGCGTGVAAAAAIGGFHGRAVLVDVDAAAVAEAASRVSAGTVVEVCADLATDDGLASVRDALTDNEGGCISCFEVIEHLDGFAPLLSLLVELAEVRGFTTVLSVPNDGFWSLENPYHLTRWSEGAVAELTSLLPDGHVVAYQTALAGSCIVRGSGAVSAEALVPEGRIPTQFIVAFGPRCSALGASVELAAADLDAHRTWERQREADLAYFKALAERRRSLPRLRGRA